MREPIKAYRTAVFSSPGVGGPKTLVEARTPAASLEEFFQYLMRQNTDLESPTFPGPTKPIHSARLKP
jgi:hypothetical protein